MRSAFAPRSTSGSGMRKGNTFTTSLIRKTGSTMRHAGRISCFAISLKHPVLDPSRWERIVEVAEERLLTPVGLRSLAPGHPDYKSRLLRRFEIARCRVSSGHRLGLADRAIHRRLVEGASRMTGPRRRNALWKDSTNNWMKAPLARISEIFDAGEPPYQQRGALRRPGVSQKRSDATSRRQVKEFNCGSPSHCSG